MIQQSHFWALNQEKQKCMLTYNLYAIAYSKVSSQSHQLETIQMPFQKINGQALWYIHPYNGKVLCKIATNLFTYEYTQYK